MRLFGDSKLKNRLAGIICLWMLVLLTFSSVYIVAEADHDCCGEEDCPICSCIEQCEQFLSHVGHGVLVRTAVFFLAAAILTVFTPVISELIHETLVSKNVRLNN